MYKILRLDPQYTAGQDRNLPLKEFQTLTLTSQQASGQVFPSLLSHALSVGCALANEMRLRLHASSGSHLCLKTLKSFFRPAPKTHATSKTTTSEIDQREHSPRSARFLGFTLINPLRLHRMATFNNTFHIQPEESFIYLQDNH